MTYWLDYSAAKMSAQTAKNAGYPGVIRYIDSPNRLSGKHTNKAEYDDFMRNGVSVLLVFEVNVNDADGGWNQGVAYAQRAKAGADYLGYKGPIFFCNDKTGVSNVTAWKAYLDGAASVLGIGRVGAYGFFNAMDTAIGHATYFWQAGRRSDVRNHVHIWQDNNVQVNVGGITCDRNLILNQINFNAKEEIDMTPDEHNWLNTVFQTVSVRYSDDQLNGDAKNGVRVFDVAENGRRIVSSINALNAKLDGLVAAVAALSNDQDLTVDQVKTIVTEAVQNSIEISGTVEIKNKV